MPPLRARNALWGRCTVRVVLGTFDAADASKLEAHLPNHRAPRTTEGWVPTHVEDAEPAAVIVPCMPEHALPPGPGWPGRRRPSCGVFAIRSSPGGACALRSDLYGKPGTMPAAVLTSDRDAIRRLLIGDPLTKGNMRMTSCARCIGDRSMLLARPAEHLARRKASARGRSMASACAATRELMQRLMVRRGRRAGDPGDSVAVLPLAQNVTIEVILQAVLGVADRDHAPSASASLIDTFFFYPARCTAARPATGGLPVPIPPWRSRGCGVYRRRSRRQRSPSTSWS